MRIDRVVVNSSPLIVLFRSRLFDLFPHLFKVIVVPEQVYEEVVTVGKDDEVKKELPKVSWIERKKVEISLPVAAWNLGDGESAVLTYAMMNPGYRVVVDDLAARRCASVFGIKTLGTGGMLILAKHRGLIGSVRDAVGLLRDSGLYLSDSVVQILVTEAGE